MWPQHRWMTSVGMVSLTFGPKQPTFMTHSMVKRMVKTRLQSDKRSV